MLVDIPKIETIFPNIQQEYLKRMLVASLYHLGKISSKEACDIIGINRREFEKLLPEYGFTIFPDSQKHIDIELSQ